MLNSFPDAICSQSRRLPCNNTIFFLLSSAFDHNFVQTRSCNQQQTYTPESGEVESRTITNDEQRNIVFDLVEVGIPVITNPANPSGRFQPATFSPSFNTHRAIFEAAGWEPGTSALFTANGLKTQTVDSRYYYDGELIWSGQSEHQESVPVTMTATLGNNPSITFNAPNVSACRSEGGSPLLSYTPQQLAEHLYEHGSAGNVPVSCDVQQQITHTLNIEKSHPQALYGTVVSPIGDTLLAPQYISRDLDSLVSFSVREEKSTEPHFYYSGSPHFQSSRIRYENAAYSLPRYTQIQMTQQ